MIAYQRLILNKKLKVDEARAVENLNGFYVREITKLESKKIILEYEWLGTMGRAFKCFGLFKNSKLYGAINFGLPAGAQSRNICGVELSKKAICLERGACTHLAPKNAASFFISRAVRLAHSLYGWEIFFAYSDEEAGEIGTIYQACNWRYLGKGVGRDPGRKREYFVSPTNEVVSGRTLRRRKLKKSQILKEGWKVILKEPKHKYVWFEGSKSRKRQLKKKCRYQTLRYPKRNINVNLCNDVRDTIGGNQIYDYVYISA